jgi:DeoR/GlpR family transcriptional regulator of sugar metabolism
MDNMPEHEISGDNPSPDMYKKSGRKSDEKVSTRKLKILELICKDPKGISFPTLVELIGKEYKVHEDTIRSDMKDLKGKFPIEINRGNICASSMGLGKMWFDTKIGNRMGNPESKRKLAEKTFSFIKKHKDDIRILVLGTGTTVHECAKELINRENELHNMRIDTDNLLVLYEFICNRPNKLQLELPKGLLNLDRAALRGPDTIKHFQNLDAEAIITSFSDMSFEKGFCTIHDDSEEKLANLRPKSNRCRWIIIPIEWDKIGNPTGTPVATTRKEQLDLKKGKKYIIITNKPPEQECNSEVNKNRIEDLNRWKMAHPDNIEILFTEEPAHVPIKSVSHKYNTMEGFELPRQTE